ncbi:preprotein translocase subunit SecE [Desulfovibrio aminophilus]|nr:preprotein translocase subunit SecE [Desulfovibrio aminophilus]MCM0753744.1 preprotein translocase subunit SecE [Desulfovibrio aminophilus]
MAKDKTKDPAEQTQQATGLIGKIGELKTFFEESKVEIKKVVWPTRKETVTTCIAVLVLVLVMSLFLGIVDLGFSKIIEAILS